ncbi:restriction endonuclease subunit S [Vibrio parahaemolyticus]|nr:restriction endonuclease subunit S [Vibrio parahaemolyticus]MBM5105477.1 restriction endonuclease subunit S [Vibrio parahaemolyticus]
MIEQMPKYDSYKESGVEWLGEIPEHWSLIPNKRIFNLKKKLVGKRSSEYDLLSLTLKGIIKRDMDNPEGKFPAEFDTYQEVSSGDFVFCLFDVEETPRTVGLSKFDGMITGAYTVFNPSEQYNREFLYYFYLNLDTDKKLKPLYKGLRNTISKEAFFSFKTFVPPIDEQVKIASYLDKKTSQIDEAIAIKQKQIELLKERKQIIIQQAVTQGLNPDAPMKDSGVDWIGEIPEHWTVSKIGHYARVYNGSTPSRDVKRYWDEGTIPWMSSGKVNDYIISTPSELITTAALRECSLRIFPKGTVLIGIVGQGKTRGTSAMLAIDAVINQNVAGIIPSEKILSEFLHQYLIQAYDEVRNQGQGSNQEALNCQILSSFKIAFPSVSEQKEIVHFIAKQSQKLDQSIDIQFNQIEKLKEYKATLINSAVTGKIKVTELV